MNPSTDCEEAATRARVGGGGNVMGGDGLRESVGVIVEQASSVL
jgi:hypothetical protein